MSEETKKTLTQLANELNVSRDKIIYRYKKLPEEDYFKENNTIYLLNSGIQKIVDDLGDDIKEDQEENNEETQVNPSFDYLIDQLNRKDEQIDQLHKLVDQQQQLNAEDKKIIKELRQYTSLEAPKEDTDTTENEEFDEKLQQKDEQLTQLQKQLEQTETMQQEKEALESELASLKQQKNKKWYQFWK
ncbi:hypothetical protein C7K38_03820 [Tetragenococcus osmophilus]|uniref:DUF536 domain-containing protein n=1 Tax=Tetragenococcus osmophilus TaxID=526944 RepID=A0AA37XML7_9ENTE|nr:hypothetical protein [Tetragenococcus osmophilus]AYW47579.1 hypothetical protein C7K38_03820 [Tetragenococcus osmophilus]GMA53202.1 hypothetical protein GCM10025857_45590 [Alicyclobacillus contaminans]GMA72826.1 hypothetical protein GCM10025885_18750 [Tetragenococcus osmophilus]